MLYPPEPMMVLGKLPGTRYSGQFYLANGLYNVEFLEAVAAEFHRIVKNNIGHFDFQLAGVDWPACPLLTGLPIFLEKNHNLRINSFLIKNKRKTYAFNNYIEGMPNKLPVLMVNDVCNSTNAYDYGRRVLLAEKLETLPFIFAVMNKYRHFDSATAFTEDRYLKNDYAPLSVVTGDDVYDFKA